MKTIKESIIGRRGTPSGRARLWQIDELVPVSSNKKGKIYDILTHITGQNNRGASCDSYIDSLSDLLRMDCNLAGLRNKAEAIEEAQNYANQINTSEYRFIGITGVYDDVDDEPEPLDWDYILGIDNNHKLFIMRRNN